MKLKVAENSELAREYGIMKKANLLEDNRKGGPATCAQ